MATTNTSNSYFWYRRFKGSRGYLGIVDQNGDAAASGLTVNFHYQEIPDEITSDDDLISLPEDSMLALAKGAASEILKMSGVVNALTQTYDVAFEKMVYDLIHRQIDGSQQPSVQAPILLAEPRGFFSRSTSDE